MVYGNDFTGGDDYGRYGGAGSQIPKTELDHITQPPAAYVAPGAAGLESQGLTPRSKWDPRGWGLKTKLAVAAAVVVAIIVIVVGSVEGTKANRYPNYSKLNYSLKDTYSGTGFFDQFNYFSGYDPADGFVQYVYLRRFPRSW